MAFACHSFQDFPGFVPVPARYSFITCRARCSTPRPPTQQSKKQLQPDDSWNIFKGESPKFIDYNVQKLIKHCNQQTTFCCDELIEPSVEQLYTVFTEVHKRYGLTTVPQKQLIKPPPQQTPSDSLLIRETNAEVETDALLSSNRVFDKQIAHGKSRQEYVCCSEHSHNKPSTPRFDNRTKKRQQKKLLSNWRKELHQRKKPNCNICRTVQTMTQIYQ